MSTAEHGVANRLAHDARDIDAPRKRDSGMHPRFVMPAKHLTRVPPAQPRREVAAMNEVGELLRSASTPRDAFARLVEVVESVVPVDAIVIATIKEREHSLVWTSASSALDKGSVAAAADALLDYFQTDAELDSSLQEATLRAHPWVSLPVTDDDGAILGLFAIAPTANVDEATVALTATIARHLAGLLARAEQLRHVFAAREHAELLARTSDRRLVEERRARVAAENTARSLRAASDATAVLLSTFDYRAALRHVARIVADQLAGGCVIDVEEELGLERVAHVANIPEGVVASALSSLVVDVMRYRSAVATARVSPNVPEGDARSRVVASQARRTLGADWIVSVPISTNGTSVLGVLTVFGSVPAHAPLPIAVAEELARRVATAIENGRIYLAALEASHQREQVLSMVSHDLKNSFCVILMSVARVLEGMPTVERRQRGRSQLELIERSARRMLKLVADLLDVAAIDAGRISVTPRPCAIGTMVHEVLDDLSPQANAAGVELDLRRAGRSAFRPSRRASARAGAHQPRRQCHQVHARRRYRHRPRRGHGPERAHDIRRRHRCRHSGGSSRARLRPVLAGSDRQGRLRARSRHLPRSRRALGRPDLGREHARRRHDHALHPPDRRAEAAR